MNESSALAILGEVRAYHGRKYKALIREAWECGNYRSLDLDQWAGSLQSIRNTFGPSWLVRAVPTAPEPVQSEAVEAIWAATNLL